MQEIYLLALVFLVASLLGMAARRLKQPLLVAYVASGALLSAFGLVRIEQLGFLRFLPDIGLAFLLFLVGMELDLSEARKLGGKVVVAAVGQVAITAIILFAFWRALPMGHLTTLLLGISFSLSSTILMVKLLLESKEQSSLPGKLSIGVSLVEDLLAILILMLLGGISSGSSASLTAGGIGLILAKGAALIWVSLFFGKRFLPAVFALTAENTELLFLTAVGWCLSFVALSVALGFSTGIGAFLAGVSLAQSVYRIQISGKVKPLRDFFIMIFFIDLGVGLFPLASFSWFVPLFLVLYTVAVKPVIFFLIFLIQRFRAHSAFRTAVILSSISEFSLIILFLAARSGLVGQEVVSPLVFATVLSFVASSFLISHSQSVYRILGKYLKKLEREKALGYDFLPKEASEFKSHAVLIGCHRSGEIILANLKKLYGENLLVVDFNPEVIDKLRGGFVPCVYGDIADPEVLEKLNLKEAKLVISTVRDLADNLVLLDTLEKEQSKAVVIITAADVKEAITLYERGAHHVSLPLTLEGTSISHLVADHNDNLHKLIAEKERKLGELKRISN